MRHIAASGGLAFGDERRELDCMPVGGWGPLRLADLRQMPQDFLLFSDILGDPHNRPQRAIIEALRRRRDQHLIVLIAADSGDDRTFSCRLRWRHGDSPVQALEAVIAAERAQGVALPGWLVMALYAAARLYDRAPASMAQFAARYMAGTTRIFSGHDSAETAAALPELDEVIARDAPAAALAVIAGRSPTVPANPLSRVKFIFALSRAVWQPDLAREIRARLLAAPDAIPAAARALIGIGAVWLWPLLTPPRLGGAKLDTSVFSPAALSRLWPQWLALLDTAEDEARALLTPFGSAEPTDALIEEPPDYIPPPIPDPALTHALARQLAGEAERQAAYAPQGVFDVALPPDLPLTGWGIARLRLVVLRPGRRWIALLDPRGMTLAACPWSPDGSRQEGRLVLPQWAWPAIDLAAAALWRDLCVAGPDAVPAHNAPRAPRPPAPAASSAPAAPRAPAALVLPRPRRAFAGQPRELRAWADQAERAAIRRRVAAACAVRGHYRRHEYAGERRDDRRAREEAQRLRQAAAARAAQFGLPAPPPGYTFVSPFLRGEAPRADREDAAATTRVVARGLNALAGLLATAPAGKAAA